jgi:hypothetical protein
MTLKELSIGDEFYPASKVGKTTPIFKVIGNPLFNPGPGPLTRRCRNLKTMESVRKSCSLEVIKKVKP